MTGSFSVGRGLLKRRFPQPEVLHLIPEALARKYMVIPLAIKDGSLQVAMANPSDIIAIEALASHSQLRIEPQEASVQEIEEAIDLNYKAYDEIEKRISSISLPDDAVTGRITFDTAGDAPIAQALNLIINEAVKARASDIHLQPQEDKLRIRYRIDGTLHDVFALPSKMSTSLLSRIKILANMNIADHHRPQDGQFSVKTKGRLIDIRVGTIPTVYGEIAVLRLLDKSRANLALSGLGFLPESLEKYQQMLRAPYGMLLISGPTGAGKTTTLYASINCLDQTELNIITIEDPVEYKFKDLNQIQVNSKAGITFSLGLRSILRLDPDVILVGEIRDAETAQIAVQGALTGHLVMSSIHANDAIGVILRLLDLGVEPFLVSSALIGVVAQRMVRRVCPYCACLVTAPVMEQMVYEKETGEQRTDFLQGSGCQACSETGYHGRTGVFEILCLNDEIRAMVLSNADGTKLRHAALSAGMTPLIRDGMLKVRAGITTPSEVLRTAYVVE